MTNHQPNLHLALETFRPGQRVALQNHQTEEWSIRVQIVEKVAPRSFTVQTTNGSILRRNQCQIRKLHSTTSSMRQEQSSYEEAPTTHEPTPPTYDEHLQDEYDSEHLQDEYGSETDTASENSDSTLPYDGEDEIYNEHNQQQTRSGRIVRSHHRL